MVVFHKAFIYLIISSLFLISPSLASPIVQTISSVNAGHYIALPESMAWQCHDTVKRKHARQIKLAEEIEVDTVIKQQMIEFEQDSYKEDLKRLCNIADLSELPDRETLMEIKP